MASVPPDASHADFAALQDCGVLWNVKVGAGGGTGKECVEYLISSGLPVKTLVRAKVTSKGEEVVFEGKDLLEVVADVTSKTSMMESIAGSRAVIFAASASKKGGDPQSVDYQGLLNVADACIANKVRMAR